MTSHDVEEGDIAYHQDGGAARHVAIVLRVPSDARVLCLFYTSNPRWAVRTRRASKEELAMAAYVARRPTYLASAIRHLSEFEPGPGLKVPPHKIDALLREFFSLSRSG